MLWLVGSIAMPYADVELPVAAAKRAELAQIHAGGIEYLHAVVAAVGHDDVLAGRIDRDAVRDCELSIAAASSAELAQVRTRGIEYLHAIVGASTTTMLRLFGSIATPTVLELSVAAASGAELAQV